MLRMDDLTSTLLLIFSLGLLLVLVNGSLRPALESFTGGEAIACGVDTPCDVGLKCINGFCAKTERLPAYEKVETDETSGQLPFN
jgi:hypothetical protein